MSKVKLTQDLTFTDSHDGISRAITFHKGIEVILLSRGKRLSNIKLPCDRFVIGTGKDIALVDNKCYEINF